MRALRTLAGSIGTRGSASPGEHQAAKWCAAHLDSLGYEVDVENFRSRAGYQFTYAIYAAVSLVAAALLSLEPIASAVLGAISFVLYARDAEGRPAVPAFGPTSSNVVARLRGDHDPKIVVLAHMDSAHSGLAFHPRLAANIRGTLIATHFVLAAIPVLGMAAWYLGRGGIDFAALAWISGVLAIYCLVLVGLLVHGGGWTPVVTGANDNASGVEVVMRLAEERRRGVWYVITGSEEAGMVGAQALLREHEERFADTAFLNIDSVGSGEIIAASAEGILRRWEADRRLLDAAIEAGAVAEPWRKLPTDATAIMARGRRAMTLLALDANGSIPNWHWPTDTIENIDPTTVDRATEIARSIVDSVVGAGVVE